MKQSETRPSLLLRIRNPDDRDAWNEFSEIYRPAIVRMAKRKGLQNADAEDLAQQVLISISKTIGNWKHNPETARFRTWLSRITTNAVINALTRKKPDQSAGKSDVSYLCHGTGEMDSGRLLTLELRREVFRYAARQIRNEFHEDTWQSFWLTAVDGLSVEDVARKLNKQRGSIYTSRSRVMRRLKSKVDEMRILDQELNND